MTETEFVLAAINAVKAVNAKQGKPEYKGMHVVYSGFNEEFKRRFGKDSREVVDAMAAEGIVHKRPAKSGVTLLLPEDVVLTKSEQVKAALTQI